MTRFNFELEIRGIDSLGDVHARVAEVLSELGADNQCPASDEFGPEDSPAKGPEDVGSWRIRPTRPRLTRREARKRCVWFSSLLVLFGLVTAVTLETGLSYFLASLRGENYGIANVWFLLGLFVFAVSVMGAEWAYRHLVLCTEGELRDRISSTRGRLLVGVLRTISTSGGPAFVGYWLAALGQIPLSPGEGIAANAMTVGVAACAILISAAIAVQLERQGRRLPA